MQIPEVVYVKKRFAVSGGWAADRKEEALAEQWASSGWKEQWKGERKYRTARPCPNIIWT